MTELTVPKLNNNDDSYILVEWLYADGDVVPAGDPVVVVETSKAAEELDCEAGGILHQLVMEQAECRPGEIIAHTFATAEEREEFVAAQAKPAAPTEAAPLVITKSAQELIDRRGVTEEALRALGKTVIKTADIEALTAAAKPEPPAVSKHQQAVAEVVTESHRTIPVAFTVAKVDVDAALAAARAVTEREGTIVGLVELLVKAVAGLRTEFPAFYADGAGVGVTVDLGKGLFIPVVPDPAAASVTAIADVLMEHRIKAMRAEFSERDFAGAGITVSLSTNEGILFAQPIVFPGQTAMVSLGATMPELTLAEDGTVVQRQVAHVGVAFDHRVINGRDVTDFLTRLAAALGTVQQLTEVGA